MAASRSIILTLVNLIALAALNSSAMATDTGLIDGTGSKSSGSLDVNDMVLGPGENARRLVTIERMQAWTIKDEAGQPTLALTTEGGLTIVGKIIGPQGEDISGALLALSPDPEFSASFPAQAAPAQTQASNPAVVLNRERAQQSEVLKRLLAAKSKSGPSTALAFEHAPGPPLFPPGALLTPETLSEQTVRSVPNAMAITAIERPSPDLQAGLDRLLEEATLDRLWFSAAKPNPGAPIIYMLTDPDCPHCQWAIDSLRSQILSGQLDLRIIPAPITGPGGFTTALSILHSDNVAETFMDHMISNTRGTPAAPHMDTKTADKAVIEAIAENINWMRMNRIGSVPFFFFKDAAGARFSASALPDNILQVAKPF